MVDPRQAGQRESDPTLGDLGPTVKVLLVEDSPGDARIAIEMLHDAQETRFDLARATRLDEALRRIARGGIDVVLLDVLLPDSMGLDTFLRLRDKAPNLPVVVLSGIGEEEIAEEMLRQGAHEYLTKGDFDSAELERTIMGAIQTTLEQVDDGLAVAAADWRLDRQVLRRMLDHLPEPILLMDEQATVRFANEPARRVLGIEPGDVARTIFEMLREADTVLELPQKDGDLVRYATFHEKIQVGRSAGWLVRLEALG